ncbi:MAG: transposase [Blastocatellia bacterium]|nr:transposase [Blastocatellia bacterium]
MKHPDRAEHLTPTEIEQLCARLENRQLVESDYPVLLKLVRLVVAFQIEVESKNVSIARLRRLMFGPRSEKRGVGTVSKTPAAATQTPSDGGESTESQAEPAAGSNVVPFKKKRQPGQGRLGAAAYTGAKLVHCEHPELQPGDRCPDPLCRGHVFDTKTPQRFLRLTGHPPIDATHYQLQTLRCSACLERFPAPLPVGVKPEKYDSSADVVMALLKYGGSLPFYRLERLQRSMGVPLPASNQYARCRGLAVDLLPVFEELRLQAAKGEIWFGDDTSLRLLGALSKEQTPADPKRKGRFTTGLLARAGGHEIALYISGGLHAGENLAALAALRPAGLPPPIVMADPEAKNWASEFDRMVSKCLTHGRRQFVDISRSFPTDCQRVIHDLGKVYGVEAETKEMNPAARLAHHQTHSQPVMENLKSWIEAKLASGTVEPNGGLGQAMAYFLRHYEGMTLFLREPQAPLDNNACEQILRRVVLHRKNSLFFKTAGGAKTGDVLCSLIETCARNQVNAYHYLVTLSSHTRAMRACPSAWLPWNYLEQLTSQAA